MTKDPYQSPSNPQADPAPSGRRFSVVELAVIAAAIGLVIALVLPARRSARPVARRMSCSNNLRQIALALHSYADRYQSLPPAFTTDVDGRPLHSWRTLILPFVEQQPLYESIDLSKPWDHPANAEAYQKSPSVYECPSVDIELGFTTYLAIVAPDSCFPGSKPRTLDEITDGLSETLMLIEAPSSRAQHWMSPNDAVPQLLMSVNEESEFAHSNGMHGVLADGTVRFLMSDMSEEIRRALMTIAGNETISD